MFHNLEMIGLSNNYSPRIYIMTSPKKFYLTSISFTNLTVIISSHYFKIDSLTLFNSSFSPYKYISFSLLNLVADLTSLASTKISAFDVSNSIQIHCNSLNLTQNSTITLNARANVQFKSITLNYSLYFLASDLIFQNNDSPNNYTFGIHFPTNYSLKHSLFWDMKNNNVTTKFYNIAEVQPFLHSSFIISTNPSLKTYPIFSQSLPNSYDNGFLINRTNGGNIIYDSITDSYTLSNSYIQTSIDYNNPFTHLVTSNAQILSHVYLRNSTNEIIKKWSFNNIDINNTDINDTDINDTDINNSSIEILTINDNNSIKGRLNSEENDLQKIIVKSPITYVKSEDKWASLVINDGLEVQFDNMTISSKASKYSMILNGNSQIYLKNIILESSELFIPKLRIDDETKLLYKGKYGKIITNELILEKENSKPNITIVPSLDQNFTNFNILCAKNLLCEDFDVNIYNYNDQKITKNYGSFDYLNKNIKVNKFCSIDEEQRKCISINNIITEKTHHFYKCFIFDDKNDKNQENENCYIIYNSETMKSFSDYINNDSSEIFFYFGKNFDSNPFLIDLPKTLKINLNLDYYNNIINNSLNHNSKETLKITFTEGTFTNGNINSLTSLLNSDVEISLIQDNHNKLLIPNLLFKYFVPHSIFSNLNFGKINSLTIGSIFEDERDFNLLSEIDTSLISNFQIDIGKSSDYCNLTIEYDTLFLKYPDSNDKIIKIPHEGNFFIHIMNSSEINLELNSPIENIPIQISINNMTQNDINNDNIIIDNFIKINVLQCTDVSDNIFIVGINNCSIHSFVPIINANIILNDYGNPHVLLVLYSDLNLSYLYQAQNSNILFTSNNKNSYQLEIQKSQIKEHSIAKNDNNTIVIYDDVEIFTKADFQFPNKSKIKILRFNYYSFVQVYFIPDEIYINYTIHLIPRLSILGLNKTSKNLKIIMNYINPKQEYKQYEENLFERYSDFFKDIGISFISAEDPKTNISCSNWQIDFIGENEYISNNFNGFCDNDFEYKIINNNTFVIPEPFIPYDIPIPTPHPTISLVPPLPTFTAFPTQDYDNNNNNMVNLRIGLVVGSIGLVVIVFIIIFIYLKRKYDKIDEDDETQDQLLTGF